MCSIHYYKYLHEKGEGEVLYVYEKKYKKKVRKRQEIRIHVYYTFRRQFSLKHAG